jgi:hypothetical protein
MRKIDLTERPMPEINPAKVCFIIEKSRDYLSESSPTPPTRRTTKRGSC